MASAKATTRKLTGKAKDIFFDAGLSPEAAKAAVTSLQVRKDAWPVSRDLARNRSDAPPRAPAPFSKAQPVSQTPPAKPETEPTANAPAPRPAAPPPPPADDSGFDPFAFGLVPIFKREGTQGLTARLNAISDVENLRAMAQAQQIILPREVRRGATTLEAVRSAILSAVEQRVSDRKAQL